MEFWMNESEKKYVTVLCAITTWILLSVAFYTASASGLLSAGFNIILSSSLLSVMVVEIIVATFIMALGIVSYISVKQNKAYKKAQEFIKNEKIEKTEKEYVVE